MKTVRFVAMAATLCLCFSSLACETSHTETDSPNLLGGSTHEETTTTHNPITGTDDTTKTEKTTP
jgi:ABC-type oligopeptide transport system substrate-binding subunit